MTAKLATHMLTVKEVAERLCVSTRTVHRWINAKTLPVHRLGGAIRISHEDFESFVASRRKAGVL